MTTHNPDIQQAPMPSLKPHAQAHLLSPTDKCKVCADAAAIHIHYGATSCFSCKAFFRRSLQNRTCAKYICRRNSMCEMSIKTRKNCQYCRYMKCLAVGMNPNYVLSEEERKRRFKKRNNSVNEVISTEELETVVPVGMSVTVNTTADSFQPEEIIEADKKMIITENKNRNSNKNDYFNQKEQAERFKNNYSASCSLHQKNYFDHNIRSKRELIYPKTACPTLASDNNTLRGSIICKNENNFPNTKVSSSEDAFKNRKNKTLVIKEAKFNISRDKETHTYSIFKVKPTVNCQKFSTLSTEFENTGKKEIDDNKMSKTITKETKQDPISEIDTISDAEDEISEKVMLILEPEIIFTEEETHQLNRLVSDHDTVYHSVNFGEVLIKEMLMCSMFGVSMSTSAAIQGYRLQVERITRIANGIKCFTNLQTVDQVALLKENADLLVSLRGAIFFDKKKKGVDQVLSSMGIDDMEIIKKMFKPLIQTHTMNHIDYNVFNSIQDPSAKIIEERYSFLQGKVSDAIFDNITTILMTYIILFSSDFCSLEDKRTVERTQYHYLRILERFIYSASSRNRACTKMAHTINAVTCVREMTDIKKNRSINHNATAQIEN